MDLVKHFQLWWPSTTWTVRQWWCLLRTLRTICFRFQCGSYFHSVTCQLTEVIPLHRLILILLLHGLENKWAACCRVAAKKVLSIENWVAVQITKLDSLYHCIIKSKLIRSESSFINVSFLPTDLRIKKPWDPSVWHLTPPALGGDKLQDISSDCEGVADGTFIAFTNQQSFSTVCTVYRVPFKFTIYRSVKLLTDSKTQKCIRSMPMLCLPEPNIRASCADEGG